METQKLISDDALVEKIKIILKFDLATIYKMFYIATLNLAELTFFAESLNHIQFNQEIFNDVGEKGKVKFIEYWTGIGTYLTEYAQRSVNRKYYHDSVIAVMDILHAIKGKLPTFSTEAKVIFVTLIIQSRQIKL